MRLIDADDLKKAVSDSYCDLFRGKALEFGLEGIIAGLAMTSALIDSATTIEAEPVRHGEWEVVDAEEPRRYGCSECKRLVWHLENYCPNCGCRMLKEGE